MEKPWAAEWEFVTTNEPIDRDIHGRPIFNSAGESYDPPITREVSELRRRNKKQE